MLCNTQIKESRLQYIQKTCSLPPYTTIFKLCHGYKYHKLEKCCYILAIKHSLALVSTCGNTYSLLERYVNGIICIFEHFIKRNIYSVKNPLIILILNISLAI